MWPIEAKYEHGLIKKNTLSAWIESDIVQKWVTHNKIQGMSAWMLENMLHRKFIKSSNEIGGKFFVENIM